MARAKKIPEPTPSEPTPMVKWIESTLDWVADHTVFAQVQKRQELLESFSFVDAWVIGCLVLSIILYGVSFATKSAFIHSVILFVMVVRMWELLPYIFKVTIFTKANKGQADIYDARRTVILMLSNYLEMIFWFAAWYSILASHNRLHIAGAPHFVVVFRESVMSMVANSGGGFTRMARSAWIVITFQNVFGLVMTILVAARIVSFLPPPSTTINK
jgi:hypothetical protein